MVSSIFPKCPTEVSNSDRQTTPLKRKFLDKSEKPTQKKSFVSEVALPVFNNSHSTCSENIIPLPDSEAFGKNIIGYSPDASSPIKLKKSKKVEIIPYSNEIQTYYFPIPFVDKRLEDFKSKAFHLNDRILTIIKQKVSYASCGQTCALMLALDHLHRKGLSNLNKMHISDAFMKWVMGKNLTNEKALALRLNEEGFTPIILYFKKKLNEDKKICESKTLQIRENSIESRTIYFKSAYDILFKIQKILKENKYKFSICLSVDHPKLCNHRIIIDEIKNNKVYIREPYSGKAYKVPINEIAKQIYDDKDGCDLITGIYIKD